MSSSEYISQLNATCKDVGTTLEAIGQSGGSLANLFSQRGDELLAAFDDIARRVKALKPPKELEDAADHFVANFEDQLDVVKNAVGAAKDKNTKKLLEQLGRLDDLDGENSAIAQKLGATDCT